jgi:hypothetical protein
VSGGTGGAFTDRHDHDHDHDNDNDNDNDNGGNVSGFRSQALGSTVAAADLEQILPLVRRPRSRGLILQHAGVARQPGLGAGGERGGFRDGPLGRLGTAPARPAP